MASIVTKVIRIYPKEVQVESMDCYNICSNLAKTASELWNEVIYFVNKKENCLDIKVSSRNGKGELGIKFPDEKFDVWEIASFGGDMLKYNGQKSVINLYQFDEIKIYVSSTEPKNADKENFYYRPNYGAINETISPQENSYTFKYKGIYTASNDYDIGINHSLIPKLVDKHEFLSLRGEKATIDDYLLINGDSNHALKRFLRKVLEGSVEDGYNRIYENLNEVQFMFEGRVVKKYFWTGKFWKVVSSDWWDNCKEQIWLENRPKSKM